jgi:ribonuclease J
MREVVRVDQKKIIIPAPAEGTIRIIPLGGVEEIGRNMTAIEFGNDIIVVDCGFGFGETDTPGVDYILPNSGYLEDNRDKVRALIVSHGHLDHIGGIPYIIDRIGHPPIYTRRMTGLMIKKRQEEFAYLPVPTIREVEGNERVKIGGLNVSFFAVTHTIPDAMGIIIETPYGDVVITGDIKLDQENGVVAEAEEKEFALFKDRNVLMLLMDSTNIERPGWSIPERTVYKTLEQIITQTNRRIIIGTFASQLERLMKIVQIAEACGKKIVIDGRSMKTNIEIVRQLGILKHKDETVVSVENMSEYPPEKLVILATGAQGDEFASLMRIGNKTHKYINLTPNDTVVLSSSVIPGNERSVQRLKDNLSRQGAHIITYQSSDVHASGHGNREEAKWIHQHIRPKFFMPQHGYHYMLRVHADLIQESTGIPENNIVIPDNSSIIEIQENGSKLVKRKEKAPAGLRVVEGQSIGELSDVLMRDRKALAQDGFCVVVATVDRRTGRLHKSPDIISRGFVYLRDNKDLMDQTRLIVRKSVESSLKPPRTDLDRARDDLADSVARFLLQQTQKNPIVIPVIVSV